MGGARPLAVILAVLLLLTLMIDGGGGRKKMSCGCALVPVNSPSRPLRART